MNKPLRVFKQQAWHDQLDVAIERGAIITVDGAEVDNSREQALAWIILRLNASNLALHEELEKYRVKRLTFEDYMI